MVNESLIEGLEFFSCKHDFMRVVKWVRVQQRIAKKGV